MLSNQWVVPNFYPIAYLPRGVRLTAYSGNSDDLPEASLQRHLDRLAGGEVAIGPVRVYTLDQIREAHADMEHNRLFGKGVVVLSP